MNGTETRPLIASPGKIIAPIPEGATSGVIRLEWPDIIVEGPFFEVAQKLADQLHPVANPVVDPNGYIFSTFSGSRGQAAPGGVSVFRISPQGGAEPFLSDLMNPTGLALNPGGTLFISCRNDGTVRKITPAGGARLAVTKVAFSKLPPGRQKTVEIGAAILQESGELMIETLPRGRPPSRDIGPARPLRRHSI